MNKLIAIAPFETEAFVGQTKTAHVRVIGVTHDSGQPRFVAMRSEGGNTWLETVEFLKHDLAAPPTIQPRG